MCNNNRNNFKNFLKIKVFPFWDNSYIYSLKQHYYKKKKQNISGVLKNRNNKKNFFKLIKFLKNIKNINVNIFLL